MDVRQLFKHRWFSRRHRSCVQHAATAEFPSLCYELATWSRRYSNRAIAVLGLAEWSAGLPKRVAAAFVDQVLTARVDHDAREASQVRDTIIDRAGPLRSTARVGNAMTG